MKKRLFLNVILVFNFMFLYAQNRIQDKNTIGWAGVFTTTKFNDKWSWHAEYQVRRANWISNPQQNLLRTGLNYLPNKKLAFRLGYVYAKTFPYGDYPLNSMGKKYTENRIFEMVTFNDNIKQIDFIHRFILEQRFVGRYSSPTLTKEDAYNFVNRLRYMFRMQIPLQKKITTKNAPYLVMYDEVFISFGENVGENVFDQNRLGILFGFKFNDLIKIESGYLNQMVQLGREIDNKNVFQYNRGFILNTIFNFDLKKKE